MEGNTYQVGKCSREAEYDLYFVEQSNQSAAASLGYAKCEIISENNVRPKEHRVSMFCKDWSLTNPLLKQGSVLGRQLMILVLYDTCVSFFEPTTRFVGVATSSNDPFGFLRVE